MSGRWSAPALVALGVAGLIASGWMALALKEQLDHSEFHYRRWAQGERQRDPLGRAHLGTLPPFGGAHVCSEGWVFQLETDNPTGVARRLKADAFVLQAHPPVPAWDDLVFCVPVGQMDALRRDLQATQATVFAQPEPDPPSDQEPPAAPPHARAYRAVRIELLAPGQAVPPHAGSLTSATAHRRPVRFWMLAWAPMLLGLAGIGSGAWLWRRGLRESTSVPGR